MSTGPVASVRARAYEVPTDQPESDGTLAWDSTTIVVVEASGSDGITGLGWTYGHQAAATLISSKLADVVVGADTAEPGALWTRMIGAVRNLGRQGIAGQAISAVDVALWDLHARRLGLPLVDALGRHHDAVTAYGSGGFCTYGPAQVADQLGRWVDEGFPAVKMKVARHPSEDLARLRAARDAIGDAVLMVDANGAYTYQQARRWADRYADLDVRWYEEPVTSDDVSSLRRLRSSVPAGMEISAGEYGSDPWYFRDLLGAEAADCPQADITRCGGFTGFSQVATIVEGHHLDLSAHTAPLLSAHAGCATRRFRHLEWFHDHVRIEQRFFDGMPQPVDGQLRPDPDRPGLGVALRASDAEPYAITD
jgi:L-alanine-DL-glutamate epimerase-like enolase superfamily enzyme